MSFRFRYIIKLFGIALRFLILQHTSNGMRNKKYKEKKSNSLKFWYCILHIFVDGNIGNLKLLVMPVVSDIA
jgi:hypothetical protein